MSWYDKIRDTHFGYSYHPREETIDDLPKMLRDDPLTDKDLEYFESVILTAATGGQADYDMFPDEGGVNIAMILLEEVKRLRVN